jgi:hypothetical protein
MAQEAFETMRQILTARIAQTTAYRPQSRAHFWFWVILCSGITVPWLTGVAVRVILQIQGKSVVPWSHFFGKSWIDAYSNVGFLLFVTGIFGIASLIPAFLTKAFLKRQPKSEGHFIETEREFVAAGVFFGFTLATVLLYYSLWQDAGAAMMTITFGFPYLMFWNLSGTAVGFGLGWAVVLLNRLVRSFRSADQ